MEKSGQYEVSGRLVDENKRPLNDLKVKALEPSFLKDKELGTAISDINGQFRIYYSIDDAEPSDKDKIDIKLDIIIDDEVIMSRSQNIPPIYNFGDIEVNKGNMGIRGRVIDENGKPIAGLAVVAEDVDFGKMKLNAIRLVESKVKSFIKEDLNLNTPLKFIKDRYKGLFFLEDDLLGHTITDDDGYYHILYPQSKYREIMDKEPDIRVIVKDKLGVFELLRTEVHENVKNVIEHMDDIVINRAWIEGWFPTLESAAPSRITQNNSFEILIDNKDVMERVVEVLENAKSYVYLTQYAFYPDFIPRFLNSDKNEYEGDDPLVSKLLDAQNKGADVKIILNENTFVPDSFDEINDYFKDTDVDVRKLWAKGPYAMHAKVMVVDGKEGFIIGSPFSQSYWDTNKHFVDEKRRLEKNEGPVHDLSLYLKGDAIEHLEEFFIELWNYLSDENFDGKDKIAKKDPYVNNSLEISKEVLYHDIPLKSYGEQIQIVRSITPNTICKKGERGMLEAYRRAITNAEDFIYLENQYFTNKYIVSALKNALNHNPELQLIMVINEVPDVPSYKSWQHYGFQLMGLDMKKLLIENPRIGVFAKWSGEFKKGKNKLRNCYIHSKVAVVDDVWGTLGSSNLDGSSLSAAEEFGSPDSSQNYLNMEMNALIFDLDQPKKKTLQNFREVLWGEHFGMDLSGYSRPEGGWLELWKDVAYDNIEDLENEEIILNGGILPYSPKNNPKEQVKDLIEKYRRIKGRFNR